MEDFYASIVGRKGEISLSNRLKSIMKMREYLSFVCSRRNQVLADRRWIDVNAIDLFHEFGDVVDPERDAAVGLGVDLPGAVSRQSDERDWFHLRNHHQEKNCSSVVRSSIIGTLC
ncbi:hypothetical protein HPP92_003574 [Vanilla planifolia]|uniref:Uncharacterized protein n=1 Tax=Vanilla planifolia TaxID=51239 RepID=A0A835SFV7_VANPL|nr:hypothetical protein HPP92_003957 [Vanilla planifolia]KAG0503502.1 hypothetical protein HPP92_003574 [Vanilla planifolia]